MSFLIYFLPDLTHDLPSGPTTCPCLHLWTTQTPWSQLTSLVLGIAVQSCLLIISKRAHSSSAHCNQVNRRQERDSPSTQRDASTTRRELFERLDTLEPDLEPRRKIDQLVLLHARQDGP